MVELHERAGSSYVERAELLRQMGRFDEVTKLLNVASTNEIGERGEKIKGWALAKDPGLKMLGQPEY